MQWWSVKYYEAVQASFNFVPKDGGVLESVSVCIKRLSGFGCNNRNPAFSPCLNESNNILKFARRFRGKIDRVSRPAAAIHQVTALTKYQKEERESANEN